MTIPRWRRSGRRWRLWYPDAAAARVAAGEVSLLHVAEGFLRVARCIARLRGRAVVVLDDLHWADGETLEVLEYLADHVGEEPVVLVLAARPDNAADGFRRLIGLVDRRAAAHVRLPRLTSQQALDMTRLCLEDTAVPAEILEVVLERADGLPFFVEEILAGLENTGALRREGDRWVAAMHGRVDPPVTYAESITRRFASLPEPVGAVVLDAALLGRRIDPALLATVTGVSGAAVAEALRAAEDLTLTEADAQGIRFRHALTRDALLRMLPRERAVSRASATLTTLRAQASAATGDLAGVMADLAEIAGDRSAAAVALLEVGRRALARGALTSAESALRRAAIHAAGERSVALDIDETLVETLALAGRADEVLPLGERLLASLADAQPSVDSDGRRRADVHLALARAAVAATDWPLVSAQLDRAGAIPAMVDDPVRSAKVATMRAVVALGENRLEDAATLADRAVEAARETGAPELLCEALLVQGRCVRIRDLHLAARCFEQVRMIAGGAALAHQEARALAELGLVDMWRGLGTARLLEARDLAAACGAPETEAITQNALAGAAWMRGDGEAMREHATATLRLSRRYRLGLMEPSALSLLAAAFALLGRADDMEAVLAEAAPLMDGQPTQLIARHAHCRAVCALTHDDLPAARTELAAAVDIVRAEQVATIPPLTVLHVLVETVHGADPRALLAEVPQLDRTDVPLMAALLMVADAVELGRRGESAAAAAEQMSKAVRNLEGHSLVQAAVIRMTAPNAIEDRWGNPVAWLSTALATFEGRGLTRPADACRTLLRKLGAPVAPKPGGDDGLTTRESEVHDLLVQGLSNKGIAERLFLSPRTVEKHVERVLAKSGVQNRNQLLSNHALRHQRSPQR